MAVEEYDNSRGVSGVLLYRLQTAIKGLEQRVFNNPFSLL